MFAPVGLEFLYSNAQSPQVLVDVDGLPALCPNLNCDYAYVAASAKISATTYDAGTKLLTITGTSLPTINVSVHFGGSTCLDNTPSSAFSTTSITCTLKNAPRAGDHKAEVRDPKGLIPIDSAVADIKIPLVVDSVTPDLANALGGDTLTITGSGFPVSIKYVEVKLTHADGVSSCVVKETSETEITCEVQKMSSLNTGNRTLNVKILNPRYIASRRDLQATIETTNTSQTIG